jgi:hypothetical protein
MELQLKLEITYKRLRIMYILDVITIYKLLIIYTLEKQFFENYYLDYGLDSEQPSDSELEDPSDKESKLSKTLQYEPRIKRNEITEFLRFFFIFFKFILFVIFLYYPYKVKNFVKLNYRLLIFPLYLLFIFLLTFSFNIKVKHLLKLFIYLFNGNTTTYRVCDRGFCSDLTIYSHSTFY